MKETLDLPPAANAEGVGVEFGGYDDEPEVEVEFAETRRVSVKVGAFDIAVSGASVDEARELLDAGAAAAVTLFELARKADDNRRAAVVELAQADEERRRARKSGGIEP